MWADSDSLYSVIIAISAPRTTQTSVRSTCIYVPVYFHDLLDLFTESIDAERRPAKVNRLVPARGLKIASIIHQVMRLLLLS